jgi:hypothetical protein
VAGKLVQGKVLSVFCMAMHEGSIKKAYIDCEIDTYYMHLLYEGKYYEIEKTV